MPNPTPFNPLKITNSSYSKNSFYPMLNPDNSLINPINSINPINTLNQINPINTITSFFPNFTPLLDEQAKINNYIQTKNNFFLNKKRSADTDINLNTNTNINININNNLNNENTEKVQNNNELKENKNTITKNKININNKPKAKSTFFCIKQNKIKNEGEKNDNLPNKKNMFTVIQKSNYVYRKRKPRKKKQFNGSNQIKLCGHEGCEGIFKTKKQLIYHHYKMNIECHNDTIYLLKMMSHVKNILLKHYNILKKDDKIINISNLYKETMKNISLDEHIETLVGFNFEDEFNINE